jgi:arylsulfatase A-like enzyme
MPPEVLLWGEETIAEELARARSRHVLHWYRDLSEYGYDALGEDFAPAIGRWLATYRTVATMGDPRHAVSGRLVELLETKRVVDNVVLVSIDTLRADRLGCYGAERDLTPNLDALATEGAVFERAYAASPWTLPSHASLFASEWPHATGVGTYDEPGHLVPEVVTLAEVLSEAGLSTMGFTGGGYLSEAFGLGRGFDFFGGQLERSSMAEIVRRAGSWLETRDEDRPFFLFLHTWEAHQYEPPDTFRERWVRPYRGPLTRVDSMPLFLQQNRWQTRGEPLSDADLRYASDLYDACIASVDHEIGRLFERLRALGLLERTLVVVTSDHGEEFLEHGNTGHGYTLYEENVRVPLLLSHASLTGRRVARPVSLVDLAPTIAALLGIETPSAWRGEGLLEEDSEGAVCFLGAAHRPLVGAVDGEGKVVVATERARSFEAYRLDTDPAEERPAAPGPEHRALLEELLGEYLVGARRGRRIDAPAGLAEELDALGYAGETLVTSTSDAPALGDFRALVRALLVTAGSRR